MIRGTPGYVNEGVSNLFDDDLNTKWCARIAANNPAIVEWKMPKSVRIKGFMFTSANDNSIYHGRNPKKWVLYGKNSETDKWNSIWSVENDTFMNDVDYTTYLYLFAAGHAPCLYYRLEILEVQGATNIQLSRIMIDEDEDEFKLSFSGDWDKVTKIDPQMYQRVAKEVFDEVYPRLWERWGCNRAFKGITLKADKSYNGIAYTSGSTVVVSVDWLNSSESQKDGPNGWFVHELGHCAQSYGAFKSSWWTENMANYARFRYYGYLSSAFLSRDMDWIRDLSNADRLKDWKYEPYGECLWFFAWMDAKYPTTRNGLGLIDSIDLAIKEERINSDGGNTQSDASFNAVVKKVSGFDNIEKLRNQYVRELEAAQWTFNGFGKYSDNYITENLPNLQNPRYPTIR